MALNICLIPNFSLERKICNLEVANGAVPFQNTGLNFAYFFIFALFLAIGSAISHKVRCEESSDSSAETSRRQSASTTTISTTTPLSVNTTTNITTTTTKALSCDGVKCGTDQSCHMVADGCETCTSPQCLYSGISLQRILVSSLFLFFAFFCPVCNTQCFNCATNEKCILFTGFCPRVPCCPYPTCTS
ncbi:hypothetical protein NECAME_00296 [Necator americanus]|uniref:Uncharacterized protein n=1 Tax=Necator americanus TaxID=51031 RepID=W2TIL9_NECAM|nr:hypothetical protein NECAME_00296 [Necator americanus]ETN81945.1 hypothetical protein NECAME_00296 [Necator americanus]